MYNANKGILLADLVTQKENLNRKMDHVRESMAKCKLGDDARMNSLLNERNILSVKLKNIETKMTNIYNGLPTNGYPEEVKEIEYVPQHPDPVMRERLKGAYKAKNIQ